MSQHTQITNRSRQGACIAIVAVLSLFGANAAHAQWASKPAPTLHHSDLQAAWSGSVVLGLVFESNGQVKDVRIVRSSGIRGLDQVAAEGAMHWRLNPAALQPSDMTVGRQHLVKFYQNAKVSRLVEPYEAHWQEL